MISRGSATLYCAGFHLNICSIRARSATWNISPTIASFVLKRGP
jgi:hypothetical protein